MANDKIRNVAFLSDAPPYRLAVSIVRLGDWVRRHVPWRILTPERRHNEQSLGIWDRPLDGAIIAGDDVATLRLLEAKGIPFVVIDPVSSDPAERSLAARFPSCLIDSRAIGEYAAEWMMERRHASFAFVMDTERLYWAEERRDGFTGRLAAAGFPCKVFAPSTEKEACDWPAERSRMAEWLADLPKPVALFAANDGRARLVLDACSAAQVAVPDEISVLGVDDDPATCLSSWPAISSIRIEEQSVAAAEMLLELMEGRTPENPHRLLKPVSVAVRESTGYSASANPFLARGLAYIHAHAGRARIGVPDVVAEMRCSRRTAEMIFRKESGRSILETISREKFARVKELLRETNLTIEQIAGQCGFQSESRLSTRFAELFGMPPSAWRRRGNG